MLLLQYLLSAIFYVSNKFIFQQMTSQVLVVWHSRFSASHGRVATRVSRNRIAASLLNTRRGLNGEILIFQVAAYRQKCGLDRGTRSRIKRWPTLARTVQDRQCNMYQTFSQLVKCCFCTRAVEIWPKIKSNVVKSPKFQIQYWNWCWWWGNPL